MANFKTFTLSIISLLFIGCGASDSSPKSAYNESSFLLVEETTQAEILKAINSARAIPRDCHDGKGIVSAAKALTWNTELYASAYEHSNDLAKSNTFSHYGSGTSSDITGSNNGKSSYFNERIRANGYVDYKTIGENIAGGQGSIDEAIKAWLVSPAHCTNIMNPKFKEIGVAVIADSNSDYGIYWTQSFGAKN